MHLLDRFKYCPACGSKNFLENDFKSKHCKDCGFTYYLNASGATAAFILNSKGELLVARRANEPARGTLDLPGGFVDPGESIEDGMMREIKEETGAKAVKVEYAFSQYNWYEYSGMQIPTCDAFFYVTLEEDSAVTPADDCEELIWMSLDKINPANFGLTSIRLAVERLLCERKI